MKLLIVTQAVDREDPVLGFFVGWIQEFAKHVESVEVICLKSGRSDLPENVRVHSLGKERGASSRAAYAMRFLKLIWRLRHDYDVVFVHMNPEYVVLGGPLWRALGKHIGLWYVHRSVNLKLRIASFFANDIFTASPEGFRLKTAKLHVVGHGIDTAALAAPIRPLHEPLRLVSVGRITPIKNLDTLIEAVALLKDKGIDATATLIGAPVHASDEAYFESLKALAEMRGVADRVHFAGSMSHVRMLEEYRNFDISVNLSPTGGLDKAVLESMAAGLLVFVSNRGFAGLFGPHTGELVFPERDAAACAEKIAALVQHPEDADRVRADLEQRVETMSVQSLIPRILSSYEARQ
ncbi:MAG: glycosyltransferase family 4 protein [Minisyncoccota bacterium]